MADTIRPLGHLRTAGKVYPNAWRMAESFLSKKGTELPTWPQWCFLPMAGWYAIVSADQGGGTITDLSMAGDIGRLAAIGTWRYTQGIYRFDPEFMAELSNTALNGEMPMDVFLRLPEWSLYIETPGRTWFGSPLYGFWVHLECDANNGRIELRLLLDTGESLIPLPVHLGPWTLAEAVTKAINEAARQAKLFHKAPLLRSTDVDQKLAAQLHALLAMVLYLCSDEPQIDGPRDYHPSRPEPKRTKRGMRLFPPDKPTFWSVGTQIGSMLRAATASTVPGEGCPRRAHIRKAHWHGYWIGSGEGKWFSYRWLSSIIVGGKGIPGETEQS